MPIPTTGVQTLGRILCVVGARPNFMKVALIMGYLETLGLLKDARILGWPGRDTHRCDNSRMAENGSRS